MIYLDYNATTPVETDVARAMRPYLEGIFGNPSSGHRLGVEARLAVERARGQVASLLGCNSDEILFTSGGSESNNAAIKGTAFALRDAGNHIITSSIDHPSVTRVCLFLKGEGFRVTYLPVDSTCTVDPAEVEKAITSETILISIMHANNEVGTIQPVGEIARIAGENGIRFHSDGAQAAGKIPVDVEDLGVDLYTVAGHKMYAPKGIGALFVRRGTVLESLIHGAHHEQNRRAGTENVLEIVGLGAAAELSEHNLEENARQMRKMRDRLHEALAEMVPDVHFNGHPELRLPNTLSLSFAGLQANTILDELDEVAASAGAACHADRIDISHVLDAMGIEQAIAMGTIRFSTGRHTSIEEIDSAAGAVARVVHNMKGTDKAEPSAENISSGNGIRLTQFTHGLGCACKIRPQQLEEILAHLPSASDPALLVGTDDSDDAAVYQISEDKAIVTSVDFFTPVVDDPYQFGAIACANALSDIYAMGARPLFALNLVGFPVNRLPLEVLQMILKGAADKAEEAGISIIGGHSVDDSEPKFGLAVTGIVDLDRVITNSGARPDDALVLTKPIGSGILATAAKRRAIDAGGMQQSIDVMSQLNKGAAEIMARFPVNACTDVTGFGLLGHLLEMTSASGVEAEVWLEEIPLLKEALNLATAGFVPGGTKDNLEHVSDSTTWESAIAASEQLLMCDAQTSGGLLISLPEKEAAALLTELHSNGIDSAVVIGRVTGDGEGNIHIQRNRG